MLSGIKPLIIISFEYQRTQNTVLSVAFYVLCKRMFVCTVHNKVASESRMKINRSIKQPGDSKWIKAGRGRCAGEEAPPRSY